MAESLVSAKLEQRLAHTKSAGNGASAQHNANGVASSEALVEPWGSFEVALLELWGGFGVALRWLWGRNPLAINAL